MREENYVPIKPYYTEPGITIYHGDCLDILPMIGQVNAVIMDPPYSSGARTEAQKSKSGAMLRGTRWAAKPIENDQMTTPGFVWLMRHVLRLTDIVQGGSVLSFIDWRQWPNLLGAVESVNLRVQNMLIWDKESFGLGNGFRVQHELIMHACNGTPTIADRGIPNIIRNSRENNSLHPSPKPVELIKTLLRVVTRPDDIIIDPFMGTGPTLIAARQLCVRAIGIEIEKKYCDIAVDRLRQEVLPFNQVEQEKQEQTELLCERKEECKG